MVKKRGRFKFEVVWRIFIVPPLVKVVSKGVPCYTARRLTRKNVKFVHLTSENQFSERFRLIAELEAADVERRLRQVHVNRQQARLLVFLDNEPGSSQKAIAQYLNRQDGTITNMLKTMANKGLLRRQIMENNERQKQVFLEPAGQKLVQQIRTVFSELEQEMAASVVPEERETFKRQLDQVITALNQR